MIERLFKPRKFYLSGENSAPISATSQMRLTLCAIINHVMKKHLVIALFFVSNFISSAQDKMIIDQKVDKLHSLTKSVSYSNYIENLNDVPENIQDNLKNYINIILKNLNCQIEFKSGYISDLEGFFKEDPKTYDLGWIASKYQFVYRMSKPDIGIKCYFLKIDMDQFGQIIECNWPREWYKEPNKFIDRNEIEKTALNWAERNSSLISNIYEIELEYNKCKKAMCWVFRFPKSKTKFDVIEIDWTSNKIIDIHSIAVITSH